MLIKTKNNIIAIKKKVNANNIKICNNLAIAIIYRNLISKISLNNYCLQQENNQEKV